MRKSLPNPLQKLLKQGLELNKFHTAVPRSERIAGAVSFSDSPPHWLPQVLGTPSPKTPNDTIPLRTVLRQNAPQAQFMAKPIHAGGNSCNRKVAIHRDRRSLLPLKLHTIQADNAVCANKVLRVDPIAERSPCGACALGFDCAIAARFLRSR